jgi:hypothetical protein
VKKRLDPFGPMIVLRRSARDGRQPEPFDEARGLYVPLRYEVGFFPNASDPELRTEVWLEMRVVATGEPPRCMNLTVVGRRDEGISSRRFRRIPFAEYLRLAVAVAVGTKSEISDWLPDESVHGIGLDSEKWGEIRMTFDELARRPVGRPRLETVVDLAEVARVAATGQPTPTKAVRERFMIGETTARRWIRRAQAKGHSTTPAG